MTINQRRRRTERRTCLGLPHFSCKIVAAAAEQESQSQSESDISFVNVCVLLFVARFPEHYSPSSYFPRQLQLATSEIDTQREREKPDDTHINSGILIKSQLATRSMKRKRKREKKSHPKRISTSHAFRVV